MSGHVPDRISEDMQNNARRDARMNVITGARWNVPDGMPGRMFRRYARLSERRYTRMLAK